MNEFEVAELPSGFARLTHITYHNFIISQGVYYIFGIFAYMVFRLSAASN